MPLGVVVGIVVGVVVGVGVGRRVRCESFSLVCCRASMVVTKLWIQHNLF